MTVYNFYPDGKVEILPSDPGSRYLPIGAFQYDTLMKNPWWFRGKKGFGEIGLDYPEIEVPKEIQAKLLLLKR